jgi:group II intron reverse transcriptase/maturase
MRNADTILTIHQDRGARGLPLERVYKHLFDPELFLRAYGRIYRNDGAMTKGATEETVDGMTLQQVHNIIGLLRRERYVWTPVRRTEIPKAKGGTRPLGIPTWSDKLVQEVLRTLLEPYYEQRFSEHSHGFRPKRGCHTALREIRQTWKGTTWFIEGDIKGCFDNIDRKVLLSILQRDIHDGRIVRLIEGLLKAGYMKDWKRYETLSGTPQGGIISPLLANIYLDELDKYVEGTLIPAYTRGKRRQDNPEYTHLSNLIAAARRRDDTEAVKRLKRERRRLPTVDYFDPDYRRLRYIRYADDFLLGFVGARTEAEVIRHRLSEFLEQKLKLTLSVEKTLITHAVSEKAKFLGYEITVTKCHSLVAGNGKRHANGNIALLMPRKAVETIRGRFSRNGKVIHKAELLRDTDYTIIQRFQSVLRGLYNYYCMAINVGHPTRMQRVKWILGIALLKTLAHKHKCRVPTICRKYRVTVLGYKVFRAVVERPGKEPLIAVFGGIPFVRNPEGMGPVDFQWDAAWFSPGSNRSEVVQRLLAGECELCGARGPVQMHHIRKLADLDRPGQRPKATWQKIMSARKRKSLAVCMECHGKIHTGRYDGPPLRDLLESRVQ